MIRKDDFDRTVPLPPGLTITAIQKAVDYIEKGLAELVEIYLEQANVFSAIVGIYGVKALDATSVFQKHRHQDPATKLKGKAVYQRSDVKLHGSKAVPANGD
jgi:hypothetical protein